MRLQDINIAKYHSGLRIMSLQIIYEAFLHVTVKNHLQTIIASVFADTSNQMLEAMTYTGV